MNVTGIANLYRSLQSSAVTTASADPVQKALEKASSRLETQRQSTQVQLSAYGQVKAGFARVEDAGKALAKGDTLSAADTRKALESLVSAYNETRSAASTTAPGNASNAANALRRTVAADGTRTDLQALGITQQRDGSLAIDTEKLDQALQSNPNAVREAAGRIGSQMQQSANRALSEGGRINATLNSLNSRAQQIESRQASLQGLFGAQQTAASNNSNQATPATQAGIASYQRMFSL